MAMAMPTDELASEKALALWTLMSPGMGLAMCLHSWVSHHLSLVSVPLGGRYKLVRAVVEDTQHGFQACNIRSSGRKDECSMQ